MDSSAGRQEADPVSSQTPDDHSNQQGGLEETHRGEFLESDPDSDSNYGATEDEEDSDHSEHKSSDYSQCRSANYSTSCSWLQSPEHELFDSPYLSGFHHDGGGSGDAFVDALDEYLENEKSDSDLGMGIVNYLGDAGSPAFCGRAADSGDQVDSFEDKHPVEAFPSDRFALQAERLEGDETAECLGLESESFFIHPDKLVEDPEGENVKEFLVASLYSERQTEELEMISKEPTEAESQVEFSTETEKPSTETEKQVESPTETEKPSTETEKQVEFPTETEKPSTETEKQVEPSTGTKQQVEHPSTMEETWNQLLDAASAPVDLVTVPVDMNPLVSEKASLEKGDEPSSVERNEENKLQTTHLHLEKKKCIMRLGSKEAENLLQLDVVKAMRTEKHTVGWSKEHLGPDELSRYVERLEVRETYMDTVWDMEDILLDNGDTRGSMLASVPSRAGSLSAPKSLYDGLWRVDSAEVIGARQRRGAASLGERVVGVREHTIYRIRVRSGGHEWEIERRYRDFIDLFQQLKRMFSRISLPSPWEKVSAESRKVFGNTSPDVVEIRSALLQVCLNSALEAGIPISTAAPLLRFLFPSAGENRVSPHSATIATPREPSNLQLKEIGSPSSDSPKSPERPQENGPFGKTIRLIVQVQAKKPLRQQLLDQRNLCAGCYDQLNSTGSVVSGFMKSLGWGRPRFCEYTGQVFCSTCHLNEKAVLPARVLQDWDFTPRSVSQLAKAYLDSIHDQPMLCVSAVNPFLYSRVSILARVNEMRGRLSNLMACVRCPLRGRVQQMLGSRRYLLEHNDFYALRDLADLSKGAFAVLPEVLNATIEKLVLHVKQQCSVCMELDVEPAVQM